MSSSSKDLIIIERIENYCSQIEETVNRFGNSFDIYKEDFVYQNACAMCIIQIGELAKNLSENFKSTYNGVPWKNIKDMRNIFAHNYGNMSVLSTWETVIDDIPILNKYCINIIKENNSIS